MSISGKIPKIHVYSVFIALFVILMTFTVIMGYIDIKGGIAFFVVSLLSVVLFYHEFTNKLIIAWAIYSLIIILNYILNSEFYNFNTAFSEILQIFSVVAITSIYISNSKYYQYYARISLIVLLIATVLSLTSIPQLLLNPGLIRDLGSITEEAGRDVYKLGIGSYSLAHSIIFLFPLLVYIILNKPLGVKYRFISIILLCVFILFVFLSNGTIPLLMGTLCIFLSLLINNDKSFSSNLKKISKITLLLVIFFFLFSTLIKSAGENILSLMLPGQSNYRKLEMFINGYSNYRYALYIQDLNTFIKNPLFGSKQLMDISLHSFFLDRLASLGLAGFLPLLLLMLWFPSYVCNKLNHTRNYYLLSVIAYLLLWVLKNVMSYEMFLYPMVVLPGLCIYVETKIKNRESIVL